MSIALSFKCTKSWDNMSDNKIGKFCNQCSKNVYDLTDKSQEEIGQLYQENNGKLCGKVYPHQLNRSFQHQYKMKLAKFCAALFLVFGNYIFKSDLHAQNIPSDSIILVKKDTNFFVLKGTIVDKENKDPIPFASVYYTTDSTNYGTTTDFDGNFVLQIDRDKLSSEAINLKVSYVGYNKLVLKDIDINKFKNGKIKLEMEMASNACFIGFIVRDPLLLKGVGEHGTTTFKREEIKRSVYR